jgi:hypothetical protein
MPELRQFANDLLPNGTNVEGAQWLVRVQRKRKFASSSMADWDADSRSKVGLTYCSRRATSGKVVAKDMVECGQMSRVQYPISQSNYLPFSGIGLWIGATDCPRPD